MPKVRVAVEAFSFEFEIDDEDIRDEDAIVELGGWTCQEMQEVLMTSDHWDWWIKGTRGTSREIGRGRIPRKLRARSDG